MKQSIISLISQYKDKEKKHSDRLEEYKKAGMHASTGFELGAARALKEVIQDLEILIK